MKSPLINPTTARTLMMCAATLHSHAADLRQPTANANLVFVEIGGIAAVEAEHFTKQTLTGTRAWYLTAPGQTTNLKPDSDPPHLAGASGGAYLEILPDTRATSNQKLIKGENFSDAPGQLAVLHYQVHFNTPGRYYVWVRTHSTGAEDNGLHVGIDGRWPESGQRWQTTQKNKWAWDCRQRTAQVHTGVPMQLYLDIEQAGPHEILFSMREDGVEMDKFILSSDKDFKPEGEGPSPKVKSGRAPAPFAGVKSEAKAPAPKPGGPALVQPRQPDGKATVAVSGELKQWHKVSLTLDGPFAAEMDNDPNPFTDLNFTVTFTHESGTPSFKVPGFFAADGNAADSSAEAGTKWRANLSPDKTGAWTYTVSFTKGKNAALDGGGGALKPFHGVTGTFTIAPTDKSGRDLRAKGRLEYVGKHHLQFAGSKDYFLKAGADAPETFLAYVDFDNTVARKPQVPLKTWAPHLKDWKPGDPTWRGGKGKGIIGAINYLSAKGVNAFSFLPYNAGGDGDNIWPFVQRDDKTHYDCSKLDQWTVVFDHAQKLGLYLHFKTQENENDDATGPGAAQSLDGGNLGPERKLYYRELVARFSHELALNWNLGEENTQTPAQQRALLEYLHAIDPYQHLRVVHTFPPQQDKVYSTLLGKQSLLTGASLQNGWNQAHARTLKWVAESAKAGTPWVVANDEQNSASEGVPPDPGFEGFSGTAGKGRQSYDLNDIRKLTLWGNLMAGGAGVEYYFGYKLPQNDLLCQDYRSRDRSWDFARIALEFFPANHIPFWEMQNADALIGNPTHDNSKFCLAKKGGIYLVYLPQGGTAQLDLSGVTGGFDIQWFDPRHGGAPVAGSVGSVKGGASVSIGTPPRDLAEDWLAILRKR
jgi:hypothetical protein